MTVRPVNGFLTSSGKYFDRESDAKAFDASYHFHKRLHTFLNDAGLDGILKDFTLEMVKDFVLSNKDEVMDYMALTNDKPRPDKVDQRGLLISAELERPRTTAPVHDYQKITVDTDAVSTEEDDIDAMLEGIELVDDVEITGDGFVQAFDGSGMEQTNEVPEET